MKIEKYFDKQLKQNCWRVDVTIHNERIRRGKFRTQTDVKQFVTDLRAQRLREQSGLSLPASPVTVNQLIAALREGTTNGGQLRVLHLFSKAVDCNKPVTRLSRVDMNAFKLVCEQLQFAPSTILNYRANLMALLNRAGELFESLDTWTPPKFPTLPRAESRQRVLRPDELIAIFDVWQRPDPLPRESLKWRDYRLDLCDVARLMLLTGARREHLETITEPAIDWQNGWLTLRSGKVKRSHLVALSASARAILQRRAGQRPMFRRFAASVPHYVCERVGRLAGVGYGQRDGYGWTMHDLRRTAASCLESAGLPYSAVSEQLGHKRKDVTAIYTRVDRENLRRAADLLESFCRDFDGQWRDLATRGETSRVELRAKRQ